MSSTIYQLPSQTIGSVGQFPNIKYMVTADSYSAITTAGYLTQARLEGNSLLNTDVLYVLYDFNPQTTVGTFGIFTVSIAVGTNVITLSPYNGDNSITLPTIENYLVETTDTTGGTANVSDGGTGIIPGTLQLGVGVGSGILIIYPGGSTTNGGLILVAQQVTAGNYNSVIITNPELTQQADYVLPNPETSSTILMAVNGTNTMGSGSSIVLDKVNASVTGGDGGSVTANGQAGVLTYDGATYPIGAFDSVTITFNNSFISSSSVMFYATQGGTNTSYPIVFENTGNGTESTTLKIINANSAAATNGTILIGYTVF